MLSRSRLLAVAFATAALLAAPGVASAAIVTNGGFETGSFSGWQVDSTTFGDWEVYSGTSTPSFGDPVPAPPEGTHAAITEQNNVSRQLLYQDVTLPPAGTEIQLSLFAYYTAQTDLVSPETLDPGSAPNEQYRIDVMRPAAAIDSVSPGDILATAFRTATGGPGSLAPVLTTVDLSAFAGQIVRIRLAVVATEEVLNAGADAIAVHGLDVGKPKLNKDKGTAKLPVTITDPGTLTLTGKGVKTRSAPASKSVAVNGGAVNLVVKAKGKTKSKLANNGKAKVKATVTYTPTGGSPISEKKKIKLKKNG
jgi:hypothetical protein